MERVGIVAEYNPFHRGHGWQIQQIRARMGDCAVLCCMSGNWVQRGECAVTDKWTRARMALDGGADLVLELPTAFSVSSAECFARGAVFLLAAAGMTTLCFGSELGELAPLQEVADSLDSDEFPPKLRLFLDAGLPFPVARQRAVEAILGKKAEFMSAPNNILAIEYLRALPKNVGAITFRRQGAEHDGANLGEFSSACALRAALRAGSAYPEGDFIGEIADMSCCRTAILSQLRRMTAADFLKIPDCDQELAGRLFTAAQKATTPEELYALGKTKRYAHARVRRVVLWAYLGLTAADRPSAPAYLRVLGMTECGQRVLRGLKKTCPLPVITKPSRHRDLLEREGQCTDLFALCFPEIRPCGREWTENPVVRPRA